MSNWIVPSVFLGLCAVMFAWIMWMVSKEDNDK